jgi:hypothetical protein
LDRQLRRRLAVQCGPFHKCRILPGIATVISELVDAMGQGEVDLIRPAALPIGLISELLKSLPAKGIVGEPQQLAHPAPLICPVGETSVKHPQQRSSSTCAITH